MRTSTKAIVEIEAARLSFCELKNETHFMPFSLLVTAADLDAEDLHII